MRTATLHPTRSTEGGVMVKEKTHVGATTAAATTTAVKASSSRRLRAEAVVTYVSQQPTFVSWAAGAPPYGTPDASSPAAVAEYLEARVAEVAAQLGSIQRAGDYARLVVLLAELLHGDLAAGVTPRMIERGLLDLLCACAAAVQQGVVAECGVVGQEREPVPSSHLHRGTVSARATAAADELAAAMPIESLLPPLIDQTARQSKTTREAARTSVAVNDLLVTGERSAEEAEMEAWENYMATACAATSADAALSVPFSTAAEAMERGSGIPPLPAAPGAAAAAGSNSAGAIHSLPSALCALITCCTASPLLCLSLSDQHSLAPAVASLAQALLSIVGGMDIAEAPSAAVRMTALRGLSQLLATYVPVSDADSDATNNTAAPARTHARTAKQAQKKGPQHQQKEQHAQAPPPPLFLFTNQQCFNTLAAMSQEWTRLLASLAREEECTVDPRRSAANGPLDAAADPEAEAVLSADVSAMENEAVATARNGSSTRSGPANELHGVLRIVHHLLQAQQRPSLRREAAHTTPPQQHLPSSLIPVTVRTLAMLPTTPSLAVRAAAFARLCVDILWAASMLSPTEASRQLLYGTLTSVAFPSSSGAAAPEAAPTDASPTAESSSSFGGGGAAWRSATDCPATDFFIALLHRFNEAHSVAHREMRDDMICLLALLLRYDVQFAEEGLTAWQAAEKTPPPSLETPPSTSEETAAVGDACTPLSLSVATVEAINAIVALLFETTCGAELSTAAPRATRNAAGEAATIDSMPLASVTDARPSALLSLNAVRSYALRFQSVATSAARRRELIDFKKLGWQLLEIHCGWQLAHLTYREYIRYHDTSFPPSATLRQQPPQQQQQHHHQRSAPIPQVTGEDVQDEAVTATLWSIQLSRLGFFDVLLLYVDVDSDVPAVVAWTREELVFLEEEAWQLLTSMILFTQHLDAESGGIRVRRHRRYSADMGALKEERSGGGDGGTGGSASGQQQQPSSMFQDEEITEDEDDDRGGVLYGADMHFIAAGGVEVAMRFLATAPPELEAVKRSALVTLAAIARTSSSGEAHLHSGVFTDKELALVQNALTRHAPTLVPFLVRTIRELDAHVDDSTGVPTASPLLLASLLQPSRVKGGAAAATNADSAGDVLDSLVLPAAHTAARWGWLPYSASLTVVFSWCLVRCIGDVVLAEVGLMRELPEMEDGLPDDDDDVSDAAGHATGLVSPNRFNRTGANDGEDGLRSNTGSSHDEDARSSGDGPSYDEAIEFSDPDGASVRSSSSDSSMGPPPGDEGEWSRTTKVQQSTAHTAVTNTTAHVHHPPKAVSAPVRRASLESNTARRRTLLRSIHEQVLRIPELFAEHGGVDLLTQWMQHVLRVCLTARPAFAEPSTDALQLRLTPEERSHLEQFSDLFLLLLDVFRAIVLGCETNEVRFVHTGGVHRLLDLMEAYALAQDMFDRAAHNARCFTESGCRNTAAAGSTARVSPSALPIGERSRGEDVLHYATTLLSDLLENCPRALDAFSTWHSRHIRTSPLTPDVQECCGTAARKGFEAVQLLLCLWAAGLPPRFDDVHSEFAQGRSGLELLRLHVRPALRTALKEEYVSRLLRRRAKLGVLQADAIRGYYRYIHAERTAGVKQLNDAVVLAYMEHLMTRRQTRQAVSADQQMANLVSTTLGLCLKVYGCLAAVGFESLRAAETETVITPSLSANLSSLERSLLVQVAALPALCVDEIATAMAEVALEEGAQLEGCFNKSVVQAADAASWRPTTPDQKALDAAADEAATRANELEQIIEVGAQVQQARESQLYHRHLVTQLRQPVGQPADGRPGAVKGAWKTQRRLSTTLGASVTMDDVAGVSAGELAGRLATRLAAEEQQRQELIATTMQIMASTGALRTATVATMNTTENDEARLLRTAPPALGSHRTPYPALVEPARAAAQERLSATAFHVTPPPRRPAAPLTERHQKRQAMIARSLRKAPLDTSGMKGVPK